jgi:ubiquinone/menaquinone biosynthesis C-methylase UbiE
MTTRDYMLPRTAEEYDRLREQARMWEPGTVALLDRVGLGAGARCLDVGCGPGEVMWLMAERVGPEGHVTGVDADAALGRHASAALHAAGHRQCTFEALDVEAADAIPGGPYDLVFARLVFLYIDDEPALLRRLWNLVAPGGHLVVQDHDLLSGAVVPELDVVEEFLRVVRATFAASGADMRLGLRMPALFEQAGIGLPDGIEGDVRLALLRDVAPLYEAIYRAVLPAALELGIATPDGADAWFAAFARAIGRPGAHSSLWPLMVGTWKRKPLSS